MPLPYRDAQNIVTVAQSRTMAMRVGVPGRDVQLWRESSKSIEDIATYRWEGDPAKPAGRTPLAPPSARVSRNFFHLLGAKTNAGRSFERDAVAGCAAGPEECVILSYDFWRGWNGASRVTLDGKSYRVAAGAGTGILVPGVAADRGMADRRSLRGGADRRGRPTAAGRDEERSRDGTGTDSSRCRDGSAWESLFEITGVVARVRYPLWSFALGLGLAIIIILPSLRLRMPSWNPRAAAFFAAKTGLLLAGVLICWIEFTHATSITMLGGTDLSTEPLSTWLFMLGSMGALVWSIADQRRRCRVCLRRLGMAAHVGCPGCLLLNWAGTELVCMEGHGMLHVPEMAACWQEPDRWTSLDDSWQGLFERS